MENRIRDSFHLIWLIAIVLCAVLAVFSLLFASCSRGGGDGADDWHDLPAESVETPAATAPDLAAATFDPEPTATPEPTAAPAEETPLPEPQG